MSILLIFIIFINIALGVFIYKMRKSGKTIKLKDNIVSWLIFIFSLLSLFISLKLFWNMGIYVDENATSPSSIYGGNLWLNMAWIRLLLLFLLTIVSFKSLYKEH